MPNQGDINDYGSAGAGSKNTPRGLDLPSELRWRSTGRSGEGSEEVDISCQSGGKKNQCRCVPIRKRWSAARDTDMGADSTPIWISYSL